MQHKILPMFGLMFPLTTCCCLCICNPLIWLSWERDVSVNIYLRKVIICSYLHHFKQRMTQTRDSTDAAGHPAIMGMEFYEITMWKFWDIIASVWFEAIYLEQVDFSRNGNSLFLHSCVVFLFHHALLSWGRTSCSTAKSLLNGLKQSLFFDTRYPSILLYFCCNCKTSKPKHFLQRNNFSPSC